MVLPDLQSAAAVCQAPGRSITRDLGANQVQPVAALFYSKYSLGIGGLHDPMSSLTGTQLYLHTPSDTFLAVGNRDAYPLFLFLICEIVVERTTAITKLEPP